MHCIPSAVCRRSSHCGHDRKCFSGSGAGMRILFLPFWYIRLTASHFKKDVSSELETALSIITTAYLRSEDILTSVEENLEYLNPPVKTVFADFVSRIRLIDPDLEAALEELKGKIEMMCSWSGWMP